MNYSSNMYPNNFGIIHQGVLKTVLKFFSLTWVERRRKMFRKIVFHVFPEQIVLVMKQFDQVMDLYQKHIFLETCFMNVLCNSKKERSKCLTLFSVLL